MVLIDHGADLTAEQENSKLQSSAQLESRAETRCADAQVPGPNVHQVSGQMELLAGGYA